MTFFAASVKRSYVKMMMVQNQVIGSQEKEGSMKEVVAFSDAAN